MNQSILEKSLLLQSGSKLTVSYPDPNSTPAKLTCKWIELVDNPQRILYILGNGASVEIESLKCATSIAESTKPAVTVTCGQMKDAVYQLHQLIDVAIDKYRHLRYDQSLVSIFLDKAASSTITTQVRPKQDLLANQTCFHLSKNDADRVDQISS